MVNDRDNELVMPIVRVVEVVQIFTDHSITFVKDTECDTQSKTVFGYQYQNFIIFCPFFDIYLLKLFLGLLKMG
jgi:hypothetical protein